MLTLSGRIASLRNFPADAASAIVRLSSQINRPAGLRKREAFLVTGTSCPLGFAYYIWIGSDAEIPRSIPSDLPLICLSRDFGYLGDGDVLRIWPSKKQIRVLYRNSSPHNHFLLTERCNHYCLMCSQPPKDVDDRWIARDVLAALPLIDRSAREIGLTGGEPTLLGDDLFEILQTAKSYLPTTAIHMLSNGRRFSDLNFTKRYAEIAHPDIMVGIPIYSDISTIHDYVVQADGAFDETIHGILNLKQYAQKVEIRVVVHRQTYNRLPQLAEFIARNLTFVDHVTFMGLEITGFTRANLPELWIDPIDYRAELYGAVSCLADSRIHVSVYNHQLCLLDRRLWPFARKSISDWKNEYMPECSGCTEKGNCGGFFSSARLRYSEHIRPFVVP
jgi:His-Xaa-Ser system radical SAM maturase HxsC